MDKSNPLELTWSWHCNIAIPLMDDWRSWVHPFGPGVYPEGGIREAYLGELPEEAFL